MSGKLVTFLYEATKVLPKNACGTFIRSQLITKCRSIAGNTKLPAQNFKPSVMCQVCGIQFSDVPPKIIIKPPPKMNRNIRRILKIVMKGKRLNVYQQYLYESFKGKNFQKLTRICKMCRKKYVTMIEKPYCSINAVEKLQKRGAKKKRKDAFCGLKASAVLSVKSAQTPNKRKSDLCVSFDEQGKVFLTENSQNLNKSRNKMNNNCAQNNKRKNTSDKFKNGRVEKNQVQQQQEKKLSKRVKWVNNLSTLLKEHKKKSNSLADFLQKIN